MNAEKFIELLVQYPAEIIAIVVVVAGGVLAFMKFWNASIVTQKDAKIAHLEERIKLRDDQLSGKFAATSPEEAAALIAQLKDRLADIPQQSGLRQAQLDILASAVSSPGCHYKISIVQNGFGSDPMLVQFRKVFKKAPGWIAIDGGLIAGPAQPDCGLTVVTQSASELSTPEKLFIDGLSKAEIAFERSEEATRDADVTILVCIRTD
ncbi:hypothetical protein [Hyphomicrobium sp. LHD-15]|uniref:hypothetical protein n=1 Tax=Hyphomicrobium sp. LHD-15 TaxID=3072142 RepID=UPI00280F4108|nr:hypothetical protein [Hyphomicrobium sp. LHD-15]MDQ8697213.1 hypothetical protein [Hyphomicrobium sp. LHD-15]